MFTALNLTQSLSPRMTRQGRILEIAKEMKKVREVSPGKAEGVAGPVSFGENIATTRPLPASKKTYFQ